MALRSPFKCVCGATATSLTPRCAGCNQVTELPEDASAFDILGVEENLVLDADALRQNFYALSKQTHPDRFTQADPRTALAAARWSTSLNRAYQTLKDPEKRALYLVERHGIPQSKQVPLELAETYFDLQDALAEGDGESRLAGFEKEVREQLTELDLQWDSLCGNWKKDLEPIAKHLTLRRFLQSMLADICRKRGAQ